uniref:electron transport complex subunit RsxG n=1 Tax=Thaumasiovibrio occultus TaxID=1891184 RepID=UPI000B34D992|nr:electron transport complex subunit RsxG [Thaumasiovibrio occultus]
MLNAIKKNAKVLIIAAIASTGLVAVTHQLTKSTILEQQRAQLLTTLGQLIDPTTHDNNLATSCILLDAPDILGSKVPMPAYIATMQGNPVAIAIETIAPDGYNGNIHLVMGIDLNGEVQGVRVLEHQETPGLGDKIEKRVSDWVDGFSGQQMDTNDMAKWQVRKDGGQFDQFTGATITPRAVVNAVARTGRYFLENQADVLANAPACEEQ